MGERYDSRVRALSRILYNRDPFLMGASISAPDDEYDSISARLVSLLGEVANIRECGRILESQGIRDDVIVREVWDIFNMEK